MGSPPQPPTPSSFSLFRRFVAQLAAAPPGRDGSTADSLPFDDNRDEKQKEGILEIIKISDSGSEKAARHDETCLAQVADEEEGSEHNLRTLARSVLDFLSVLKGGAQEGRSEHNHLDRILDSGAGMHATGNLRLLSAFKRAPGGSSAAVYHTRDGKDLRIAGAGMIACDKFHLPHVHYVPELGSRFTLASVQLLAGCDAYVISAFDNRKLIPKRVKENFAAAFTKERVDRCPPRWLAPFASSPTNPGGLVLDSGASIHAVGDVRLLTDIMFFSIDMWIACAAGTYLRIVGTGTLKMDGFSIPKVHLVDGLKMNLISVSQLDKDHGLCCCFHSKQCEVQAHGGRVVGGAILHDDGMYQLYFLEVPPEPEE